MGRFDNNTRIYPNVPQRGIIEPGADPATEGDSGGFLAHFIAKLDIGFSSVVSELRQGRIEAAKNAAGPTLYRKTDTVIISASGIGVIRLTGPDQGHLWIVAGMSVGGLTPTTSALGRADVFVTAMDLRSATSLAQIGLADWRDQATALPNVAVYSGHELTARLNEEIFIVISGGTVGQQYVASISVTDYQEAAAQQNWGI